MLTPESIVTSLEWSKKLKEAGWPQGFSGVFASSTVESIDQILPKYQLESGYFYWFDVRSDYTKGEIIPQVETIYCNYPMIAAAPTAEEILRRLPVFIRNAREWEYTLETIKMNDESWLVQYRKTSGMTNNVLTGSRKCGSSLANAAASMYVYLAENKLLPPHP